MFSWFIRLGASTVSPTLPLPLPSPSQYICHSYHTSLSPVQCCSGSHTFHYPLATMKERRKERSKTLLLRFHFCSCLVLFFLNISLPKISLSTLVQPTLRICSLCTIFSNFDFNEAKSWNLTLHGTKILIVSYYYQKFYIFYYTIYCSPEEESKRITLESLTEIKWIFSYNIRSLKSKKSFLHILPWTPILLKL